MRVLSALLASIVLVSAPPSLAQETSQEVWEGVPLWTGCVKYFNESRGVVYMRCGTLMSNGDFHVLYDGPYFQNA